MVQIIQERTHRPTIAQKFTKSFGMGSQMLSQHAAAQEAQKLKQQQMEEENQFIEQLTGHDISGITDPAMRRKALELGLQGMNQQQLEGLRQGGRSQQTQQKQAFLSSILGGNGQQPHQQQGEQMQRGGEQQGMPLGFDPSSVSDSDIARAAAMDPAMGRELRAAKDTALKEKRFEREFSQKQNEKDPEYQRNKTLSEEQTKSDVKYYNDLNERRSKQILKQDSLNRLENLNKRKVTGKVYESFLDKIGLTAKTSEGRRAFSAEAKNQFNDFKQIVGSQMSANEFFVLTGVYPNADFSTEANNAIIENLKLVHDTANKEHEIAMRLKKENNGKPPENVQDKVNDELHKYISKRMERIRENLRVIQNEEYGIQKGYTLMFDNQGEPLSVPDNKVSELLDLGQANLP